VVEYLSQPASKIICGHLRLDTVHSFCRCLRCLCCNGRSRSRAEASRAAETTGTPYCVFQLVDDDYVGHDDPLDDELGDTVANLYGEIILGEIGQDDANRAAVVCVDYAGKCVDAVLVRKTGAGCYSAIYTKQSLASCL
jgi:hypothetical protein